ncbi:MAG TPA: response regulator [Terriglobales bacterium]
MSRLALVVDDSMLIRHTVCRFLEARGYAVQAATNGAEAVEILQSITPDLIVTDMEMPRMTGSELITWAKSDARTAGIPIVIVAGRQSGFEKTETRANYAIFKDIDIEQQLGRALDQLMGEPEPDEAAEGQSAGR